MQLQALLRTVTGIALLAACACNKHESLVDTPVSPTPPVALLPVQPDVATVNLTHSYVHAGNTLRGVVNILAPAPGTGATVALSSNDPGATVPATVSIAPGEKTGEFTVTTLPVRDDRHLLITGRTAGRSAVAALTIFSELPLFFTYTSDADEYIVEGGGVNRLAPLHAELAATCAASEVRIEVDVPDQEAWTLIFRAPQGSPLRAGTYEGVTQIEASGGIAGMSINGRGRFCSAMSGRFIIREIDLQNDRVNRFRVSFEQQCTTGDLQGLLQGEVQVAGMPPSSSGAPCQR